MRLLMMPEEETNGLQRERTSLAQQRTRLASERNRLANERTFLSWIRTGLAITGGGIAVIRFLTFERVEHQFIAKIAGVILIAMGMMMFFLSSLDYWASARQLTTENGYAGSIWSITLIALTLVMVSFVLVLMLSI
jgi:putative membrane protein